MEDFSVSFPLHLAGSLSDFYRSALIPSFIHEANPAGLVGVVCMCIHLRVYACENECVRTSRGVAVVGGGGTENRNMNL